MLVTKNLALNHPMEIKKNSHDSLRGNLHSKWNDYKIQYFNSASEDQVPEYNVNFLEHFKNCLILGIDLPKEEEFNDNETLLKKMKLFNDQNTAYIKETNDQKKYDQKFIFSTINHRIYELAEIVSIDELQNYVSTPLPSHPLEYDHLLSAITTKDCINEILIRTCLDNVYFQSFKSKCSELRKKMDERNSKKLSLSPKLDENLFEIPTIEKIPEDLMCEVLNYLDWESACVLSVSSIKETKEKRQTII
jgi:hypothetical protein